VLRHVCRIAEAQSAELHMVGFHPEDLRPHRRFDGKR